MYISSLPHSETFMTVTFSVFEVIGILSTCWICASIFQNSVRVYYEHARLQADKLWLYKHCMQNEELKTHTDACNSVLKLFDVSPLQAALMPPPEAMAWIQAKMNYTWECYDSGSQFIARHQILFLVVWILLFLLLPRLILMPFYARRRVPVKTFKFC